MPVSIPSYPHAAIGGIQQSAAIRRYVLHAAKRIGNETKSENELAFVWIAKCAAYWRKRFAIDWQSCDTDSGFGLNPLD